MTGQLKITLHVPLQKMAVGTVLYLPTVNGIATDAYWRKKIKESKDNGCLTVEDLRPAKPKNTVSRVQENPKKQKLKKQSAEKTTTVTPKENEK